MTGASRVPSLSASRMSIVPFSSTSTPSSETMKSSRTSTPGTKVGSPLAFATMLTLFVVPVLYALLIDWKERRGIGRDEPGEITGAVPPVSR